MAFNPCPPATPLWSGGHVPRGGRTPLRIRYRARAGQGPAGALRGWIVQHRGVGLLRRVGAGRALGALLPGGRRVQHLPDLRNAQGARRAVERAAGAGVRQGVEQRRSAHHPGRAQGVLHLQPAGAGGYGHHGPPQLRHLVRRARFRRRVGRGAASGRARQHAGDGVVALALRERGPLLRCSAARGKGAERPVGVAAGGWRVPAAREPGRLHQHGGVGDRAVDRARRELPDLQRGGPGGPGGQRGRVRPVRQRAEERRVAARPAAAGGG
jgi:hypothetical protein